MTGRGEIVLVDDDSGDLELARLAFGDCAEGAAIRAFTDAESALDYLRSAEARPRVVLLDLNMPGMDGRAVLSELKADVQTASTVVIVFTTSSSSDDVQRCYRGHANAFISKPSDLSRYRTVARRIIDFWFNTVLLPE